MNHQFGPHIVFHVFSDLKKYSLWGCLINKIGFIKIMLHNMEYLAWKMKNPF